MKCALLVLLLAFSLAAGAAGPGDSIYLLRTPLLAQDGHTATLDIHRGQPAMISMFYGSCPHVCPMLIASIRHYESQLDPGQRAQLRVLLVSLDPERDTPAELAGLAARHRVDLARWTFAQTPPAEVRKLAAVLGIQYRQLPDGSFNHASVITLLDREGRITRQTRELSADAAFLGALRAATTVQ